MEGPRDALVLSRYPVADVARGDTRSTWQSNKALGMVLAPFAHILHMREAELVLTAHEHVEIHLGDILVQIAIRDGIIDIPDGTAHEDTFFGGLDNPGFADILVCMDKHRQMVAILLSPAEQFHMSPVYEVKDPCGKYFGHIR